MDPRHSKQEIYGDGAMTRPVYIWAFPGIGKSSIHSSLNIVDADSERFKYIFPDGAPTDLHQADGWCGVLRNDVYPQNYLNFIKSVDADVVLLNCHISLLEHLDREKLLLIYPSLSLKQEYLARYAQRGDNESYIQHMRDSYSDMIHTLQASPFRKYEVTTPHTFLQNLLDGGCVMNQFITKKELTQLLGESIQLGVYTPPGDHEHKTPEELAQSVFEGEIILDISRLKEILTAEKQAIAVLKEQEQRRGGLTRDELSAKIMQGIVNGALGIEYSEIAPYSHGYEVTFGGEDCPGSTRRFINRWECYNGNLFDVPQKIVSAIEAGRQNNRVFGSTCGPLDIHEMLRAIDDMEANKILSFTPEQETDFERASSPNRYPYRSSVASVMDVHAGKGLDGIVQHHYHGTYSTMTPVKQNTLVELLVCMKGFCLDCIDTLDASLQERQAVVDYLKAQGIDVSTPEKLADWIKANPEKCALPKNRLRKPSLESQIGHASEKSSVAKQNMAQESKKEFEH